MASRERECASSGECGTAEDLKDVQRHGIAAIPLRKSSTTASASDSSGLDASLSSRRRSDPVSISPSMNAAKLRIDPPNRAAIDRVLQHRRHEVEMPGVDAHVFAAGFRFEFDIERIADNESLQKVLVRRLDSELRQDEFADSLERRYRRVVRRYRLRHHLAQTLEHRSMYQLVLGVEVEIDSALGDLRFLGDAVDRGALHTVSSHHAACGFEDFADAIFLDYFFFGHRRNWTVSQMNVRSV